MSKEIPLKMIVGTVSNEKGVSEDVIFEALEAALVSATKKKYGAHIEARVVINRKTGTYDTFRFWTVVADPELNQPLEFPYSQITLSAAQLDDPEIQVGDTSQPSPPRSSHGCAPPRVSSFPRADSASPCHTF